MAQPTMMAEKIKPHYLCNKQECITELKDFGENPHKDLSLQELRVLLREMRKRLGLIANSQGPSIMKQIKDAKRDELRRLCSSREIPFTNQASVGELRLALRQHVISNANGETVMEIGRHAGGTFNEILHNYPKYAEWAIQEVNQAEDADWRLIQFAKWAEKVSQAPELWAAPETYVPGNAQQAIQESMNRKPKSEQPMTIKSHEPVEQGIQHEMMHMMKNMMVEFHTMKEELQELKSQSESAASSKNRKTTTSQMSFEQVGSK